MDIVVPVNFIAVIVSAVVAMVIGAAWYSPNLFGRSWQESVGTLPEDPKSSAAKGYVVAALANLLMAYILAHFIFFTGAVTILAGAVTGFWAWLGFVSTTTAIQYVFEGKKSRLYWINTGMALASLVIMGSILAVWQ